MYTYICILYIYQEEARASETLIEKLDGVAHELQHIRFDKEKMAHERAVLEEVCVCAYVSMSVSVSVSVFVSVFVCVSVSVSCVCVCLCVSVCVHKSQHIHFEEKMAHDVAHEHRALE